MGRITDQILEKSNKIKLSDLSFHTKLKHDISRNRVRSILNFVKSKILKDQEYCKLNKLV